jgi:anti-sigma B factor antagonist
MAALSPEPYAGTGRQHALPAYQSHGKGAQMITSVVGNGAGPWEAAGRSQRTLTLAGNIDVTTDEAVRDRAARALRDQPDVLVVDLRELDFCDGAGVRALRWVLRRAALVGTAVCIIPPGEHVRRVLTLLGANDLLAAIDSASPARAGQLPGPQ